MMTEVKVFEHFFFFYLFVILFTILYVYEIEFLKHDHLSILARFMTVREKQQIEASVIKIPKKIGGNHSF